MTAAEEVFFTIVRNYAEPRYGCILEGQVFRENAKLYWLTFRRPDAPRHITREVTAFEVQFRDAVARRELGESVRRNIDLALGGWISEGSQRPSVH